MKSISSFWLLACLFLFGWTQAQAQPVANCRNASISLTPNLVAVLNVSQINNGSTGGTAYLVNPSTGQWVNSVQFNCAHVGVQSVLLVVVDSFQRMDTCSASVTITDPNNVCGGSGSAPVAQCQNRTLYINPNGIATLTAAMIDNGSTNASSMSLMYNGTSVSNAIQFNCANLGFQTVGLVVTSATGQSSTCSATVVIRDSLNICASRANASCYGQATLTLNPNRVATLTPVMLDNGSTGGQLYLQGPNGGFVSSLTFGCADLGRVHTVVLVVVDSLGRIDTCMNYITVLDGGNYCNGSSTGGCYDSSRINNNPCPAVYAPVCGCDGITYNNACEAENGSGITRWTPGPCGSGPNTPCINPAQIDSSIVCPAVVMPVCGCNGVTYNNACEAENWYGVTTYTYGPCNGGNPGTGFQASAYVINNACGSSAAGNCHGQAYISVYGGQAPFTFMWMDSLITTDSTRTNMCSGTYLVTIVDARGATFTLNIVIGTARGCVWPGDTDDNTVVNYFDVLPIALTHGETGFVRPNASLNWNGQAAQDWNTVNPIPGLPNYKHIDANGDGIINQNDLLAIRQNYGQSYFRADASMAGNLPFYVTSHTATEGDRLSLPIVLGSATHVPTNVYGVAFTINYDPTKVQGNSVSTDFSASWLGNDLLVFENVLHNQGKVEVTVARKDRMNITNFGTLGTFNLTIRDDILRSSSNTSMDVTISNVRLIDNGNQIYGTDRQTGVVTIQQQVTSIDRLEGFSVNVFPNPTHHDLNVEVKDATIDQIQVMTVTGQVVQTLENLNSPTVRIALGELPAGVYNLSVRTDKGQRNQMVIKAD
jgi:hypothetical protein